MQLRKNRSYCVPRYLLLFLLAGAASAGTATPLFVAVPNHATTVDGGLSRGAAFGDADGDAQAVAILSIDWPSGHRDTFNNIAANQHLRIREGDT